MSYETRVSGEQGYDSVKGSYDSSGRGSPDYSSFMPNPMIGFHGEYGGMGIDGGKCNLCGRGGGDYFK